MKIRIFQIAEDRDRRNLMYRNFECAESRGGVAYSDYTLVFAGEVPAKNLEEVYAAFNISSKMPENYCGRSLSVSDVVVNDDGDFFVDSIGFVKLDDFTYGKLAHRAKVKSEWRVQSNIIGKREMYVAYRLLDVTLPMHGGNIEYSGGYSEDEDAVQRLVDELNAKEAGR